MSEPPSVYSAKGCVSSRSGKFELIGKLPENIVVQKTQHGPVQWP